MVSVLIEIPLNMRTVLALPAGSPSLIQVMSGWRSRITHRTGQDRRKAVRARHAHLGGGRTGIFGRRHEGRGDPFRFSYLEREDILLALPTRQNESVNAGQGHSPHKLLFDDSHGSPNTIEQVLRSRVQVTDAVIADDIGSSIISHARLPARCLRSTEGRTHHAVWRPR